MLLGKPEIERYLSLGNIIIDPFVSSNLGSAQYDVTLGDNFYREVEPRPHNRMYNPFDEAQVRQKWMLDKPISHEDWIERSGEPLKGIGPDDRLILLTPGEMILAHTNEFIGGACDSITTMMKARSSLGRNCVEVCRCAGMGDIGYFNRWTMEIVNTSRYYTIPLVVGRRVAQLLFLKTDPVASADIYDKEGKYQTSSSLEVLKRDWKPEQMLPKQWNDRECRALKEQM